MATLLPIKLSQVCRQVNRIIALYPPVPVVQNTVVGSIETSPYPGNYTRDESLVSFGFPVSRDLDTQALNFVSGNSTVYHDNVFPLPVNAYVVVKPSEVYRLQNLAPGTLTQNDTKFSVLLLDVTVCPVEPGFSRLRVDYTSDIGNGQFQSVTEYLDVPFWAGWDTHPREKQEIVDFAEQSINLIQEQINYNAQNTLHATNRAQQRGLAVSGTIATTQSTMIVPQATLLLPGGQLAPHTMPVLPDKLAEIFAEIQQVNIGKTLPGFGAYNILDIQPQSVYGGESFSVILDAPALPDELIYMSNIPLETTVNGNILVATVPAYLTYGFQIGVQVGSEKTPKSSSYMISVLSKPVIKKLTGVADIFVARGGTFQIQGTGFGLHVGSAKVLIPPSTVATITSWTDSLITGTLPPLTDTGTVTLTTSTGKVATYGINSLPYSITDNLVITPGITTVVAGNTVQYYATLNSMSISANWSLENATGNISNGNIAFGKIDASGLYHAPIGFTGTLRLRVLCNVMTLHGSNSTTAALVVNDTATPYTLSPATMTLQPSLTQQFQLFNGTTIISQGIIWTVNGIRGGTQSFGFISTSGIYQAPATPPPTGTVAITASIGSGFGTSTIRLLPKPSIDLSAHNFSKVIPVQPVNGSGGTGYTTTGGVVPTGGGTIATAPTAIAPRLQIQLGTTAGVRFLDNNDYTGGGSYAGPVNITGNSGGNGTLDNISYSLYSGFFGSYTPSFVQSNVALSVSALGYNPDGSSFIGNPTTYVDVIRAPLPVPTLSNINSVCPGQNAVVTGTHFPSDSQIKFSSNNQSLQIVGSPSSPDGTNYSMTVQIPSSLSNNAASYPIYLSSSSAGNSNTINFNVPSSCATPAITASVAVSPANASFAQGISGITKQFSASLQFSNNTSQDVSQSSRWYVNGVFGGDSAHGTITQSGLYTSSSTPTSGQVETVSAIYTYNNSPLTGTTSATYISPPSLPPLTAIPPVSQVSDCVIILVKPSFQKVYVPGPQIQFVAHQTINGTNDTVVQANKWFVNGVQGGDDIHGHVDNNGLYTPPTYYAPGTYAETEVAAQYNANSGYAVIQYIPDKPATGPCIISTVTQVNINFGDGRLGFILPGTPDYALYPGHYLLAVYQEYLDFNMVPTNVGPPQSLSYSQIDAKSNDLANAIYNEGVFLKDTTGQAVYVKNRTIVLGVCDPTSGYFQSMWDLMRVINPINNTINPSPTDCTMHDVPMMLTQHVESKLVHIDPIRHDNAQYMFTGQASLTGDVLTFSSTLNLVRFDSDSNSLILSEVKTFDVTLKSEQVLIVEELNNELILKPLSLGDTLPEASRIYVLGVYLNQFYSLSPFFQAKCELETSPSDVKFLRLGNMLFQWGCSNEGDVSFAQPFTKNFTLNTKAAVLRKDLNGFSFTIIEKDKAQNWFAVGS